MNALMLDSITKIALRSPAKRPEESGTAVEIPRPRVAFRAPSERTLPLPLAKTVADERATTRMRTAEEVSQVSFPRKTQVTPNPWTMPIVEVEGSQSVRVIVREDPDADNLTRLFWACAMLLMGVAIGGTIWLAASHATSPRATAVAASPPPPAFEVVPTATVVPPPPTTGASRLPTAPKKRAR